MKLIDVNVSLGHWPFQRFAVRTPAQLERRMRRESVATAWVSAIESVLHPDPDVYDDLLATALAGRRGLRLVKTVNPTLAGSAERLDRWCARRRPRAVKLFPGYHGYDLGDERVAAVMALARRRRLAVMVQMRVEDERSHHPLMKVPPVSVADVARLARAFTSVPVVALCAYLAEARTLTTMAPNVHVDLSFLETLDTVASALTDIPVRQLLFGKVDRHIRGGDVQRERRDERAAHGRHERPFPIRCLAASDQTAQSQDIVRLVGVRSAAGDRLEAALHRGIIARQIELAGWSVICRRRDLEDIKARKLVDQLADASDVIRAGPALLTAFQIDDVRRRAGRGEERRIVGNRAVGVRVAPMQRELGRTRSTPVLDDGTRKPDDVGLRVDATAVFREAGARFLASHQHSYGLQDLERRLVNPFDLRHRE